MRPKILLATTNRWFASARLAMAFQSEGVSVDAVCPPGHPLSVTSAFGKIYRYGGLSPLSSIRAAMRESQPSLVIPCDDLARSHLNHLHAICRENGTSDRAIAALIERSLGDPQYYPLIDSRSPLIHAAIEEGIVAPETGVVRSLDELKAWVGAHGVPAVLKTDGTSGGRGVKTVMTREEAERAFLQLNEPPQTARAIKRAVFDHDWSLLKPWATRRLPLVNIQKYVSGRDATIAVACWQGTVLAALSVEVFKTWKARGPASVVKTVEKPEMLAAAQKLVRRLNISGLCGFDFVIEDGTGEAHLIEMNPRATQTAHLAMGTGRNLPAALGAAVADRTQPETNAITEKETIALFPPEWQNDSASPWLQSAFHDVPWEEPRLVALGVKSKLSNGGLLTYDNLNRLTEWLMPNRSRS